MPLVETKSFPCLACTTTGGDDGKAAYKGTECMFPFTYGEDEYYECIYRNHDAPWCYTDAAGYWGNCDNYCPRGKHI